MSWWIPNGIRCVVWAAALYSFVPARVHDSVIESPAVRARNLVAADIAADAGEVVFAGGDISAERDSLRLKGAEVWRVDLPVDHAHPFLVAVTPSRAIPLAGFSEPDLYTVSRMLGQTDQTIQAKARLFAILADPYGASHVVFALTSAPRLTADSLFVRRWREALPNTWPRDTAFKAPSGENVVVQSVLSRDVENFGQRWTAIVYRFVLAPNGAMASWSRTSTEPFQVPEKMIPLLR